MNKKVFYSNESFEVILKRLFDIELSADNQTNTYRQYYKGAILVSVAKLTNKTRITVSRRQEPERKNADRFETILNQIERKLNKSEY
ncbi:hypothetical protein D7X33_42045, partial [Butyricicoccus sp. 1XD8-22]